VRWGYDRAIKKAFDAFALDPKQPDHWRRLLGILADILFGERGKGPNREGEDADQITKEMEARGEIPPPESFPPGHVRVVIWRIVETRGTTNVASSSTLSH